jgi:hypothetical protein
MLSELPKKHKPWNHTEFKKSLFRYIEKEQSYKLSEKVAKFYTENMKKKPKNTIS